MNDSINKEVFKQINKLVNKYENCGLSIDIEFSRWGLILIGSWEVSLNHYEGRYHKSYTYELLEALPEEKGLEFLIDEFKKEIMKDRKGLKND